MDRLMDSSSTKSMVWNYKPEFESDPIARSLDNMSQEDFDYLNNLFRNNEDQKPAGMTLVAETVTRNVLTSDEISGSTNDGSPDSQCHDGNSSGYSTAGSSPYSNSVVDPDQAAPSVVTTNTNNFHQTGASFSMTNGGLINSNVSARCRIRNHVMARRLSGNSFAVASPDRTWISNRSPFQMTPNSNIMFLRQPYIPNQSISGGVLWRTELNPSYSNQLPNHTMAGVNDTYRSIPLVRVMHSRFQLQAQPTSAPHYQVNQVLPVSPTPITTSCLTPDPDPPETSASLYGSSSVKRPKIDTIQSNARHRPDPDQPGTSSSFYGSSSAEHPKIDITRSNVGPTSGPNQPGTSASFYGPSSSKAMLPNNDPPTQDGRKVCLLCGKTYKDTNALIVHYRTHEGGIKPFKCDICKTVHRQKAHLDKHKQSQRHRDKEAKAKEEMEKGSETPTDYDDDNWRLAEEYLNAEQSLSN